jgi:hypothetical protein
VDEVAGVHDVGFDSTGMLLIVIGEGSDSLCGSILRVDTAGFSAGDPALDRSAITERIDISGAARRLGAAETNPYKVIVDPSGNYYVVDAAANAVFQVQAGEDTVTSFALFPDVPNPVPGGPPMVNSVPTGAVWWEDTLYVCELTGFPFATENARIYTVSPSGTVQTFRDGFTNMVDICRTDSALLVVEIGRFSPPWVPNSGAIKRVDRSATVIAASDVNLPTAVAVDDSGNMYATLLSDNIIVRIPSAVTGVADEGLVPGQVRLDQNYPNPFNPSTTIGYDVPFPTNVQLTVHNTLGQLVRELVSGEVEAGYYEVSFNATGLSSGLYFYRLKAGNTLLSNKMVLVR